VIGHGLPRAGAIVWVRTECAASDPIALRADLRRAARTLPDRLRPARYLVIGRPASIDAHEVTTTLKLRRTANAARHAPHFASAWLDEAPLDGTEEITWRPATS
jgi:hypothetical protein